MTVANSYNLYGVDFDDTLIGAVSQQGIQTGSEVSGEALSGEIYPRWKALVGQAVTARWATNAVAVALGQVGVRGLNIGDITAGLVMYGQQRQTGGGRQTTLKHRKYVMKAGIIVPRQLTVEQGGDASITYEVLTIYDGSNSPLVESDLVTLPTQPADDERFALGPLTIGSVDLTGVQSMTIDFGIDVQLERADGDIWDTFSAINSMNPTVTWRGVSIEWLKSSNIPLGGKAGTQANTTQFLRKRAIDNAFVADATAEHAKFTMAGLTVIQTAFDASAQARGEADMIMHCRFDGTDSPVKYTANQAIE